MNWKRRASGLYNLTGFGLDIARTAAVFNKQTKLKELYPTAVVIGKEKVDSVDAYVLQMGFEKWFFDVDSGLLLRKGNTHYADYRLSRRRETPFPNARRPFLRHRGALPTDGDQTQC